MMRSIHRASFPSRSRWTALIAAVAIQAVSATSESSFATTLPDLDEDGLARAADLVVVGTCTDVRAKWVDGRVITSASVRVSESLKGDSPSSVTVVSPGGSVKKGRFALGESVPGALELHPGEELLLYLASAEPVEGAADARAYSVIGLAAGRRFVVSDESGAKIVTDAPQVKSTVGRTVRPTGAGSPDDGGSGLVVGPRPAGASLEAYRARVRRALSGNGAGS